MDFGEALGISILILICVFSLIIIYGIYFKKVNYECNCKCLTNSSQTLNISATTTTTVSQVTTTIKSTTTSTGGSGGSGGGSGGQTTTTTTEMPPPPPG